MSDGQNVKTEEFVPEIYICTRFPSLGFQPQVEGDDGVKTGEHWNFSNGIFICDTEQKKKAMHLFLKTAMPYVRQLIKLADKTEASQVSMRNMLKDRREKLAVAGPFTSDVMSARNQEVTELQLQADMRRMGIQPETAPENEFTNLAKSLKNLGEQALGVGGDNPI